MSVEEASRKREQLLELAEQARVQYERKKKEKQKSPTSAPTKKKAGKRPARKKGNVKRQWRKAFKSFWRWLQHDRKKRKKRGGGGGNGKRKRRRKERDENWVRRNKELLRQTLEKLNSYDVA